MKWILVTEKGKAVALLPGSMEEAEEPKKEPGRKDIPEGLRKVVAGPNQKTREIELPDDLAQETNPEEFVKKVKKAAPDIEL